MEEHTFTEEGVSNGQMSEGPRVLVIDDDPSVGAAIQMTLNSQGCFTAYAPDGDVGIEAFNSSRFDLVLVDICMAGTSGLEVIKDIRRRAPNVPIIAMSGFRLRTSAIPDLLGIAAGIGATSCLRKPFAAHELMGAIKSDLDPAFPGNRPE